MLDRKITRILLLFVLFGGGIWLVLSSGSRPAPESAARQRAIMSLAPAGANRGQVGSPQDQELVTPVVVDLADIPARVYDPNNQLDRWLRGEIDLAERDGIRSTPEIDQLRAASQNLPASSRIQTAQSGPELAAPTAGISFDALDYTECCGGGGNVPPDPELAVGPNHAIAVVNVAFKIFDKSGGLLVGPTTFASFMNSDPNCTGVFDPNVLYDESADRFILGIDADGSHYCIAASQTGDPTGSWNIYSFSTINAGNEFFDYPHAGVGNDAIFMGANIFTSSFLEGRVYAFDKAAMYAGNPAASRTIGLGFNEDTPQPLNLHGWNQGTWPTSGPHYILTETNYDGALHTIFSWDDPFGANNFNAVTTVNLNNATGVTAGYPVNVPQNGGSTVQANDWRPQDFEYRNGYGWMTNTQACPGTGGGRGGGTVNCVRWAQIDLSSMTVADAGVYGGDADFRFFGDLAVNHCDDMAIGYSKSGPSMWPSIWVTGREHTDAPGTLQAEVEMKAGELAYTAFDSVPRRWGDYTEMTIDPDGTTFWYLGEYSKNTGTSSGRWGTYIGSFSYSSCSVGPVDNPPSVTVTDPAEGATVSGSITIMATASDDNGVTQVEFFVDGNSLGVDNNGGDGWSMGWDTTTGPDGAVDVTAEATDTIGQTGSDANNVTVDNVADPDSHVGDLDGSSTDASRGRWNATVEITVHDDGEGVLANATVSGDWSGGASGSDSCVTDGSGQCSVTKNNIGKNDESASFTVTDISHASAIYNASANHDPDGDSDGTSIVLYKPGSEPPPPPPDVTAHVGDLDSSTTLSGRGNKWNATVTISVHDEFDNAVEGAIVEGNWSAGASGSGSCTTDTNGICTISKNNNNGNVGTITFTVTNITNVTAYDSGANHDPDPDSDGTTIIISQP